MEFLNENMIDVSDQFHSFNVWSKLLMRTCPDSSRHVQTCPSGGGAHSLLTPPLIDDQTFISLFTV